MDANVHMFVQISPNTVLEEVLCFSLSWWCFLDAGFKCYSVITKGRKGV